jgi:DNA-binding response OmpR family regulator
MSANHRKPKILVVEDDEFISRMYVAKLEREGFDVLSATDGQTALDTILSDRPDLVILDVMLPKRDGFSVLAEVKRHQETKDIPVVVLTNLSQQEQVDRCFSLGAKECLIKAHFTPGEVVAKVREHLGMAS